MFKISVFRFYFRRNLSICFRRISKFLGTLACAAISDAGITQNNWTTGEIISVFPFEQKPNYQCFLINCLLVTSPMLLQQLIIEGNSPHSAVANFINIVFGGSWLSSCEIPNASDHKGLQKCCHVKTLRALYPTRLWVKPNKIRLL